MMSAPAAGRCIVLATRNPGKLRELRELLADLPVRVASLDELPPVPEPAEDGATFAENARHKALYYARACGQWCLADDSGLVVDALGGEPGVHSARYSAHHTGKLPCSASRAGKLSRQVVDAANNARLLQQLADVPDDQRTARFVCNLALADPQRVLLEASGEIEGVILRQERGCNGFGYDPLFMVPHLGLTTAELPAEHKNAISHRGRALARLKDLLTAFLAQQSG